MFRPVMPVYAFSDVAAQRKCKHAHIFGWYSILRYWQNTSCIRYCGLWEKTTFTTISLDSIFRLAIYISLENAGCPFHFFCAEECVFLYVGYFGSIHSFGSERGWQHFFLSLLWCRSQGKCVNSGLDYGRVDYLWESKVSVKMEKVLHSWWGRCLSECLFRRHIAIDVTGNSGIASKGAVLH